MAVEASGLSCRGKKVLADPVASTTNHGKPSPKGTCPVCGSTICRIGKTK